MRNVLKQVPVARLKHDFEGTDLHLNHVSLLGRFSRNNTVTGRAKRPP
jgi:hypothetical protein